MDSDYLGIKNQANGQASVVEKYPFSVNIEDLKNKMGRGRGRPPKNSCSSSGSTCSENSNKDVTFDLFFYFLKRLVIIL
jgi:hypothetical protein